ncbi:Plasmid replication initiator protein [Sphingomonas palmae]|uniref:Plasmid replication initiator protein n=1 Tax=Sphingomonas palmae TaxID=1855283 RepID=A0A1H7V101_9SPHN|nr:replication initiator protein A [Sphingomonas palmae]SEM02515.1 Plasmid replication initiator protein [Sphingomonas palmae]
MTQVPAKPSTALLARTPAPARKRDGKGLSQRDLFQLDSPLYGEIRGERSLMAFPFFALSKNAWMKPLSYEHATVSIEVRPSANGVATIYDKEIVLYIASLMAAKLEAGEDVAQDFIFTAHDLFSVTGSNHSARSYQRLSEALERLQGTQIKTNIEAGGEGEEGFFSWLSEARLHYSKTKTGERRLKAVKVRLCDWLFRAILRDRQVLNYAATYFQLGPIERRIYEVARSTCEDGRMEIDLATFRLQIGYQNPLSNFRAAMRGIAGSDTIPDYAIELIEDEAAASTTDAAEGIQRRGRRAAPARVVISYRPEPTGEEMSETTGEQIDVAAESLGTAPRESARDLPE